MSKHPFLTVKGKPFFSVGSQTRNSCSYFPEDMADSWRAARLLGCNTVATPIPWERFEPEEDQFDEDYVRKIIDEARKNDLKLTFLWFATWKNGTMEYTPNWVKKDTVRFPRAILKDGTVIHQLSAHSQANLEADKKAFCRLMQVIRDYDSEGQTVLAVQVENEPGILGGTKRDFSPLGEAAFKADVPQVLIDWCKEKPDSMLASKWTGVEKGDWQTVFGRYGAEAVTAYAIATYIDEIARAGKEVYDLFLYQNVWLDGCRRGLGYDLAGISWPSGGAVDGNLDIYYAVVKSLDTIAPDNYQTSVGRYHQTTRRYANPDKGFPLFVPESERSGINASLMFDAIGNYGAIGYHIFGSEQLLDLKNGGLIPFGEDIRHSLTALSHVAEILPEYLGTDKIWGIAQEPGEGNVVLDLGDWKCAAGFYSSRLGYWSTMDYRHMEETEKESAGDYSDGLGRGLLIRISEDEFYLVGHRVRLFFMPPDKEDGSIPITGFGSEISCSNCEILRVAEGHLEDGKFVAERIRSGDESRLGVWAQWDCGVIYIKLLKL